jgi:Cu(I)/Ag(I) efflux system membrane protein CusA/SilA
VPIVILINLLLLYLAYREIGLTLAIFAAIPITFAGGFIGIALWPIITGGPPIYLTTAVWIGFIALFGIAVDDGAVMATYLQQSFARLKPTTRQEVREAVLVAGLRRIRPCLMTTFTTILALIPVLLSDGRGADVMRPMAIPLVGGMVAELVTLFVLPALYSWIRERRLTVADAPGAVAQATVAQATVAQATEVA